MKQILFSTAMVQAILEDRKTMTRRIAGPIRSGDQLLSIEWEDDIRGVNIEPVIKETKFLKGSYSLIDNTHLCPYGQVGDILWVRESWQLTGWDFENGEMSIKYKTGEIKTCPIHDPNEDSEWLIAQVDQLEKKGIIVCHPQDEERFIFTNKPQPWKPSIHMPKEACRLFLKIKSIKVERLQQINEEDAIAEGVLFFDDAILGRCFKDYEADASGYGHPDHDYPTVGTAKESFFTLWQSINGPDSWSANPWVWVIEFERTEKPHNF